MTSLVWAFVAVGLQAADPAPATQSYHRETTLSGAVNWSGTVWIHASVTVAEQATVTVAPGTRVFILSSGPTQVGIINRGRFLAKGTEAARIRVASSPEGGPNAGFFVAETGSDTQL